MIKSPKELKKMIVAITISLTPIVAPAADAHQAEAPTTETITAKIVEAKSYTESYVLLAKENLAKNPADLLQAQKLYATAFSKYNAWVAYVKTSLEAGKSKRLGTDANYQKISTGAAAAGKEFTDFVDAKLGESKAVTALLSSLGSLGIQLWNGIKDREDAERAAAATNFEQETKWLLWEAINANSEKPTPSAQPSSTKKPDASTKTISTTPTKPQI